MAPLLLAAAVLALLLLRAGDLATAWTLNRGFVQTLHGWQTPLREGIDRYTWRARQGSTPVALGALPSAENLTPATAHSVGRLLWLNGDNARAIDYLAGACATAATLACNDYLSAAAADGDAERVVNGYAATLPALPFAAVGDSVVWAYLQAQRVTPVELIASATPNLAFLLSGRPLPTTEAGYLQGLRQFTLASVWPAEAQLLPLMLSAADELVDAGVWDAAQRQRLAAFWLWQYPRAPELAAWPPAAALAPLPPAPSAPDAPDNLLAALNPASVGWPHSDWRTADYLGADGGAFLAGTEGGAIRIDGLWHAGGSGFFGVVASPHDSAAGSYFLPIEAGRAYQIAGSYRSAGSSEAASLYIGNPSGALVDLALAPTDGTWAAFSTTACSPATEPQMMQMLLRLRTAGSVWFGNLVLRPLPQADSARCPAATGEVPRG